jgi:hypothetical protein
VFLPVKAVVLVVLSLGASLGSLLALATTKLGATLIGARGPGDIHPIVPITIVAITVALSTDYEVILISRIAEHYRRTGDNRGAVVSGIEHTGSVITSAAAIMVAVFAGFALADLLPLKQLGVGLALAVFLDATVVRGALVPAAMAVMGGGNWWWPRQRPALQPGRVPVQPGRAPLAQEIAVTAQGGVSGRDEQPAAAWPDDRADAARVPDVAAAEPSATGRANWWAPEQMAALSRRRAAFAQEIAVTAQERGVAVRVEQHAAGAPDGHADAARLTDAETVVMAVMDQASWRPGGQPAALQQDSAALPREPGVGRIHYAADIKQTVIVERIWREP